MARRSPWFSLESDNDEIDLEQDVLGTDTELDETAVDDAGDDSETVDVTPDTKETAHNEQASAGGVATGNNQDELEMDPVAATESFCRKFLGLSREDMEEAVDEIRDEVVDTTDTDTTTDNGNDDEMNDALVEDSDEDSGTTVNITSPHDTHIDVNAAGDEVEVGTDAQVEEPMSASDVAAVEGFRRLWSMEDDEAENNDVELDVKTSDQDTHLEFENKAVTIEPNEDVGGGDDYGADQGGDDYGADAGGSDAGEGEGGENTEAESGNEEGGDYGESSGNEETNEGFYFW